MKLKTIATIAAALVISATLGSGVAHAQFGSWTEIVNETQKVMGSVSQGRAVRPCPAGCAEGPCQPVVVSVTSNPSPVSGNGIRALIDEKPAEMGSYCETVRPVRGFPVGGHYRLPFRGSARIGSPCRMAVGGGIIAQYSDGRVVR